MGGSPDLPEHLLDVAAAYELAELARKRATEARQLLVAAIERARFDHDETLQTIGDHLGAGVSRQYVQKLIREAERDAKREAEYARWHENAPGGSRNGPTPQCAGCKRFLKRHDDVCPNCGYAGHGGYVAVPAKTSHLERWR